MDVPRARFTRLARLGLLVPVKFYVNRYRAVVWLYLADELRQFAADERNAALLKGRTPEGLRDQLTEGLDLRPRNWRGRHLGVPCSARPTTTRGPGPRPSRQCSTRSRSPRSSGTSTSAPTCTGSARCRPPTVSPGSPGRGSSPRRS